MFQELRSSGFKDVKTLKEVRENMALCEMVDDKTYLMERVIRLVSALPVTQSIG